MSKKNAANETGANATLDNENDSNEAPAVEEKVETPASKPGAIKDGFVFGLVGASVKDGDGPNAKVIRRDWTRKGMDFTISNLEAPFPTDDHSAALAAADMETSIFTLDENGIPVKRDLKGLAAAVSIALTRRENNIHAGYVSGKFPTEEILRKVFASTYGFTPEEQPPLSADDIRKALTEGLAAGKDSVDILQSLGIRMNLK